MGFPFTDITLYTPIPDNIGKTGYWDVTSLQNFVSDLYVQKMHGYKPPKTIRITIQPAFHETWKRTWKLGSNVSIAPYYNYDEYAKLDTMGKYRYTLDLIQSATIPLSEEYGWDKSVFEKAYKEVLESGFVFEIEFPAKQSRDRKKTGSLVITKTETRTSMHVKINIDGRIITRKLFEKKNVWWYDCAYLFVRHSKWFDKDRFGVGGPKRLLEIWYSLEKDEVAFFEEGIRVKEINFRKFFPLE